MSRQSNLGASLRDRAGGPADLSRQSVSAKGAHPLRVLIACERSGVVRRAFRALGHDAWSCDLEPPDDGSPYHIMEDAIKAAYGAPPFNSLVGFTAWSRGRFVTWDLLIAHPECTYLANCSAKNLYLGTGNNRRKENGPDPDRWAQMGAAAAFFMALWNAPVERIAVENPIMLGHPRRLFDIPYPSQIIQPWQFGHGETKATCLWLKNLPPLEPTNIVEGREQRVWKMGPGENRKRDRSRTFEGIAAAMAEQWGGNAIADGRRMAETTKIGSVRSTTSGGAEGNRPDSALKANGV